MLERGAISVSLTNVCNLKCRMCGSQNMDYTPAPQMMSEAIWQKIVEALPQRWTLEINACGEHTLHPSFMQFVNYFAQAKAGKNVLKLSTNGMWQWNEDTTRNLIGVMRRLYVAPYRDIQSDLVFSIDGGTKETAEWIRRGSDFGRVLGNVRQSIALAANEIDVGVAFVAMRRNLHEAIPLLRQLPGLGRLYLNLLTTTTEDMIPESLYGRQKEYLEEAERIRLYCLERNIRMTYYHPAAQARTRLVRGCVFPNYPWIDAQGNVHLCCMRWDRKIGNIGEMSWDDIANRGWELLRSAMAEPQCDNCFRVDDSWSWRMHFANETWLKKYTER